MPIAVQLYSLRRELEQDFEGGIRRLAAMGYDGVETAGIYGAAPAAAAALFRELGLQVAGAHLPLPLGDQRSQVLETAEALGLSIAVCSWLPPEKFTTQDGICEAADTLNEAAAVYKAHGLRFAYHNHGAEFQPLPDGRIPAFVMLPWLSNEVLFEIDCYWAHLAGSDVPEVLTRLGDRVPLLHIKDGPLVHGAPMVAVGDGAMNFPPILAASRAEWLIVELDECATDMFTAVERSLAYLRSLNA